MWLYYATYTTKVLLFSPIGITMQYFIMRVNNVIREHMLWHQPKN